MTLVLDQPVWPDGIKIHSVKATKSVLSYYMVAHNELFLAISIERTAAHAAVTVMVSQGDASIEENHQMVSSSVTIGDTYATANSINEVLSDILDSGDQTGVITPELANFLAYETFGNLVYIIEGYPPHLMFYTIETITPVNALAC